ncbi:leucine-rich repeat protein [Butyricimonas hominis]|uniref:Leucine-rich repeat protein n=1 Tax=Butyricimonas hominis TaxID=2763032 RepID=A0ABR7D1S7_9BACT|nr:leucine-rich repeat protein [Butyricimonas hominis]MBC5621887.1 leucine-rich repeat protein [Butyricimonas hominis]
MMKARIFKAFALLLWLGLWQTGCYPDKFDPEGDEVGPIATLDFSNPSVEFKAEAESRTVMVTTNYKTYRVDVPEEAATWCHVTSEGMTLTIAVDENPFNRERSATISVTVGKGSKELTKTVSVFQAGTLPQVKYSSSQLIFKQKGAVKEEVSISTNQDEWTYNAVGGDAAWFEVTRDGDKLQIVPKGDNPERATRKGYINLTSSSAATEVTATGLITVEQLGTDPALRLSENAFSLSADGGERRVRVVTNQPEWQLHTPPVDWYETRVEGDEVVVSVKKNTGGNARKSELTVATPNGKVYANLSLAQLGTAFSLEVSADTIAVDASESYTTLWVTTNAEEWTASVTGGADWCELMEDANTVTVYTKAYGNTTVARECAITFTAGSLQKTVRVIQLPDMTLMLNHDTLQMAPAGENRNVLVLTNQSSWTFAIDPEITGWCSAVASGNTLTVTATANNGSPRSGEIVVSVGEPGMKRNVVLTVTQEGGVSDRETLIAFYNATGGQNWINNANWCSDKPLSEWYGVTCNGDGRVIKLELDGNNLIGNIPSGLGKLSELQYLGLGLGEERNQLTGNIPPELGNLTNLQTLRLSSNALTGSIPKELSLLVKLEYLELCDNRLSGEIPVELGLLTELTNLFLHMNQLTGNIPAELGNLQKLERLFLMYNQLTGNIPKEFGKLITLSVLALHDNNLSGNIPEELGNLTGLYSLLLHNNQLTGIVPASLGNITGLGKLVLYGNRLTGVFPEEIKRLPNWNTFNADVYIYPQQEGYGFSQGGGSTVVDDVCCVSSGKNIVSVNVSSGGIPSVDIPSEYSWLKCISSLDGEVSTLQFSVDTNTTRDYRKGLITVRENGTARTIGVYQGVGDSLYIHVKTPGALRELVGKERMTTTCGVKLSGTLGQDDYDAMKYSMTKLTSIDMEEVEDTSIPARAFHGKSAFRYIVLPSRLEEIGDNAFYDCGFKGELKLPGSVTKIGYAAFQSCNNFTGTLELPDGLKEVGEYAFAQCTGLRGDLILPDGIEVISRRAFYGNYFDGKLVLPATCVEIGESAFNGCESLTGDVIIPDGVRIIGKEAFNYCKKITGVTLSAALEEIGESAFDHCIQLAGNLVVPSNVKSIGDKAFADCAFEGALTLPYGLETIGMEAFRACSFTGQLSLPSTLTRIGKGAFSSCSGFTGNLIVPNGIKVIEASVFSDCRGFNGALTLPSGLEEIGDNAFWNCKSLSGALVLPASLRMIGENAFSYCDAFTGNLTIPEGVTTVKSYAFACKSIGNTIILPSTLVSLGYQAFYGMPDIKYVRCNRAEPLVLSLSPFANASECTLIVPKGSLETYKAANKWNEFAVIEEE